MKIYNFNYPVIIDDYVLNIDDTQLSEEYIKNKCSDFFNDIKKELQLINFKLFNIEHKKLNISNNQEIKIFGKNDFCFMIFLNDTKNTLDIKSPAYPHMDKDSLNIKLNKGRCILFHECLPYRFNIETPSDVIQGILKGVE